MWFERVRSTGWKMVIEIGVGIMEMIIIEITIVPLIVIIVK